jgi:hypothetical protein
MLLTCCTKSLKAVVRGPFIQKRKKNVNIDAWRLILTYFIKVPHKYSLYLLPPQWEIIFFPSHKNTKNINTFVPQDSHINIRLETYKHNKIQGPSDLYCKPCSLRSGLQFKNPETPRPKDCSISHCTGFNFGVMFCLAGPTVRPTMKRERSRCWCLHACNSLASKLPRKKIHVGKSRKSYLNRTPARNYC